MPILTPQERIGTCVGGRYRIDRVLARGGMSVLFEAHDTRALRTVAVKLLKTEDCVDEHRVARFLQEMRLTAQLRDPHVVDVLDLGQEEEGAPYLVLELLRGQTLQAELEARGMLGIEAALAALLPVMLALTAVHAAGVIHRDVKPDNIFLHVDESGRVVPKLLDFGIAKLAFSTFGTRSGALLGTPEYMAPEQVLGAEVTAAADVWAVGAILYRALCGVHPFAAATTAETLGKLAHEPAPLLRVSGLSPALCAAVDRALLRDVGARYANMWELANAIATCAREAGFVVPELAQRRAQAASLGPASGTASDERYGRRTEPSQDVAPPARAVRGLVVRNAALALALVAVLAAVTAFSAHGGIGAKPVAHAADASQVSLLTQAREPLDPLDPRMLASAPAAGVEVASTTPAVADAAQPSLSALAAVTRAALPPPPPPPPPPSQATLRRARSERRPLARSASTAAKQLHLGDLPVALEW